MEFALSAVYSVIFEAEVSFAFTEESVLDQMQNIIVKAKRPGSIYIENVTPLPEYKPGVMYGTNPYNVFVSDGKNQYELAREAHLYVSDKAASRLSAVQSKFGLTVLVGTETLFAADPLSGFSADDQALTEDASVLVFSRIVKLTHRLWKQQLSISAETGLPVRLSIFRLDKGLEQEVRRTTYSNWLLNPELSENTFDPTPPANAKPIQDVFLGFSKCLVNAKKRSKPKWRDDW